MVNSLKRKIIATALVFAMIFQTGVPVAFAADTAIPLGVSSSETICTHHTHDADCGYSEGTPCNHEHKVNGGEADREDPLGGTEECYNEVESCIHEHTDECYPNGILPASSSEAAEPTECTHVCGEECISKELICKHEHDADCGYTEGTPCNFDPATCEICNQKDSGTATDKAQTAVKQLIVKIDALPSAGEITDENREDAKADYEAVFEEYDKLSADESIIDLDGQLGAERMAKLTALREVLLDMVTLAGEVVSVTINDTTIKYTTFDEALTAAQNADTASIQLLKAVSSDDFTVASGKTLSIDLNGVALNCTKITVASGGTLNMSDSSGDKSGKLNGAIFTDGELNISGGTYLYTGDANYTSMDYRVTVLATANSTGTISGGVFKRKVADNYYVSLEYVGNAKLSLTGGTFEMIDNIHQNTADKLTAGYCFKNADGVSQTYPTTVDWRVTDVTVAKCEEHSYNVGFCTYCKAEDPDYVGLASVTINGTSKNYFDLSEAFNAANGNTATITMLEDVRADGLTLSSGTITLDLNGKKIESGGSDSVLTVSGADVTIQNGTLKHSDSGSTINVTSGTLLLKSTATIASFFNYKYGLAMTGGTATIDGASFTEGYLSVGLDGGSLIINSGDFAGEVQVFGGNLQCKGGSFTDTINTEFNGTYLGIQIMESCDQTLADLLANGYAFRSKAEGKAWVSDVSGKELSNVTVEKAPVTITTQPQSKTVYYGYTNETLSLSAAAVDSSKAIAYQWYSVGAGAEGADEAVAAAATSTLTIPQGKAQGEYQYYCKVTCDGYELKSDAVTVTVAKSGTAFEGGITTDKANHTATYGDTINVSVTPKATGNAPATFALTEPTSNEMALFVVKNGVETQLTAPQAVTSGTKLTFAIDTSEKGLSIGANTIKAKYVGDTNTADYSETITITLEKKAITSATVTDGATKVYDGTTAFAGVALTLNASDITSGDTVTATANGTTTDANSGANKAFTATSVTLNGTDKDYYSLANNAVSGTVEITKANLAAVSQEYLVVKELAKEYSFTLANLLPSIETTKEYGNISYTVGTVTNTDNVLTKNPTDSDIADGKLNLSVASVADKDKTATVTISMTTDNFTVSNAVLTVKTVDKKPLTISDVAMPNREYNAVAYSYTGTPTFTDNSDSSDVTGVTFIKEYEGKDGTSYTKSEIAPTNAGSYNLILTVSGKSAETYDGTLTVPFAITKKEVTVTAKDKDILVGEAVPSLANPVLGTDYTTDGFFGSDTLGGAVSMSYTGTPDNTQHGSYPITISGGTVSGNYTVKYVSGTLSITIDVTVINTAITAANEAKTGIKIFDSSASSVANGTKFVTTAEMNALTTAIQTATEAKATVTTLAQAQAAATALDEAVATFKAAIKTGTYTPSSGGGGGSTGGGSDNSTIITPPATTENPKPATEVTTTVKPTVSGGTATVNVSNDTINSAIQKAQDTAKKNGTTANGIVVEIKVETNNTGASSLTANLPKASVDALVKANTKEVRITSDIVNIHLNLDTLKEIQKQVGTDVNVAAKRADSTTLSEDAKKLVGNRPVYDFSITGANGKKITDFGNGKVSVSIPYTLGAKENPANLVAYYIDNAGKVSEMPNSVYNPINKTLSFVTDHFSKFAVGYKEVQVTFTDTSSHWAKDSIEFVVVRGILAGTGDNKFSPNTAMTRGMFVTALGRLAEADVSGYTKSSFTDVKADTYYMGYVEWASQNGIVNGMGDGKFAPDQSITREQMAVIMANYAKAIGFALPKVHAENVFTDNSQIGSYAKDAVKQMQMAGILSGKNGNLFDPQGTATRAEVSAVLKRFVELVINTDSAEGWTVNDSGKWMYYENGKAVTGKKNIDGTTYTFDQYGVTADVPKNRKNGIYVVQRGDSFWLIAYKQGCTIKELEMLNNKTRFSLIHPGDELIVPDK